MKIWILNTKTPNHRIVKLNCEEHSGYEYLGDLNDDEINKLLFEMHENIDIDKNMKLLKYYGFLHLLYKE